MIPEKKRAFIVSFEENFLRREKLFFYRYLCAKIEDFPPERPARGPLSSAAARIYGKIMELLPFDGADFFCLHLPAPDKEKQLALVRQFLFKLEEKWGIQEVFFKNPLGDGDFSSDLKKKPCVFSYQKVEILRKFASLQNISLKTATCVVICDHPEETEPFLSLLCREVYRFRLVSENAASFREMNSRFFRDYGIFLRAEETIGTGPFRNTVVVNLSLHEEIIRTCAERSALPILNLSSQKCGVRHVYEDVLWTGNNKIEELAKRCGGFCGDVLSFLFSACCEQRSEEEFRKFVQKYGIKYVKLKKND